MTITKEQLISIIGNKPIIDVILPYLNNNLEIYKLNTSLRICHFLTQVLHESGCFVYNKENLNYSTDGLLKIFPKYFNADTAKLYEHNPEKIANKVYANRMGNGDENSGDGFKFCGRGYIQITGRSNYTSLTKDLNVDFVKNSSLLETPQYAISSAFWFWDKNSLNDWADKDDILTITRKINGGSNGIENRKFWLNICKQLIK